MNGKREVDKPVLDPAEYLFLQTKFHDCHLSVGDPATGKVEKIAVVTSQLAAHSTVFRDMLVDSKLCDPTGKNTHITDVRPQIFKLMLKHVYGGCVDEIATMSKQTALELALCADKYNIQPLVKRASERLIPATVVEVFLALFFVAYAPTPVLVPPVTKIIQEETDSIIKSKEFMTLDENCIEFIIKQEKLAITELDLWRSLVKWTECHAKQTGLTPPQVMNKLLIHLRLATLSENEILKNVMPTNILTSDELVEILTAVTRKQSPRSPRLCRNMEKRKLYSKNTQIKDTNSPNTKVITPIQHVVLDPVIPSTNILKEFASYKHSNVILKAMGKDLLLESLTCKTLKIGNNVDVMTYNLVCTVRVYNYEDGFCSWRHDIAVNNKPVVYGNNNFSLPLTLITGQPLILCKNSAFSLELKFNNPHPVFKMYSKTEVDSDQTNVEVKFHDLAIKFNNFFHVIGINYKI